MFWSKRGFSRNETENSKGVIPIKLFPKLYVLPAQNMRRKPMSWNILYSYARKQERTRKCLFFNKFEAFFVQPYLRMPCKYIDRFAHFSFSNQPNIRAVRVRNLISSS